MIAVLLLTAGQFGLWLGKCVARRRLVGGGDDAKRGRARAAMCLSTKRSHVKALFSSYFLVGGESEHAVHQFVSGFRRCPV